MKKQLALTSALWLVWVNAACAFPNSMSMGGFTNTNGFFGFNGVSGGVAPPVTCPQGTGFPDDGCAAADQTATWRQSSAFQPGGYFNTLAATTANYMNTNCGPSGTVLCRPPWNVAGVDYPVGHISPVAATCNVTPGAWVPGNCLMDPQANPPTGCTIAATGVAGSPDMTMNCTGATFAGVIKHYNFGPVNNHDCTGVNITNAGGLSTLDIEDNYYLNNSGACATNVFNNNVWFYANAIWTSGVTLVNNTFDFNNSSWDTINGPCAAGVRCNGWFAIFGNNKVSATYNVFLNSGSDFLGGVQNQAGSTSGLNFQYNVFSGWCSRGPNCHKEMYAGGNAVAGTNINDIGNATDFHTFDHDTIVNNANATTANGPTQQWLTNGYGRSYTNGPTYTNNTVIEAHVGGRPVPGGVTITGCLGNSYTSGNCVLAVPNNTLFVTSASPNVSVGYGATFNCGTTGLGNAISVVTYKLIPGPYPSGVIEEWGVDGIFAGNYYPTWDANATGIIQTCPATIQAEEISNGAIMASHGATPYGSPVMKNNYMDIDSFANGSSTPTVWNFSEGDFSPNPLPVGQGSITGNVLTLTTAASLGQGYYVDAVGIPGCTSTNNFQGCPRLFTGGVSTTTFTLNQTYGTPIPATGTEAIQIRNITFCTVPAVLSGNRSMTGPGIADSWLNQLSTTQTNSGC